MIQTLIKKDFISIFKSKLAIFALFLFPLLVVLVLCISLNVLGFQNIKIVYYKNLTPENTETFNSILELLQSKNYILSEVNSYESCIEKVKLRIAHICIIPYAEPEGKLNLQIYTDETKLNLAYALINQISQLIEIKSEEISIGLIQIIIDTIELTEKKVKEIKQKLDELGWKLGDIEVEKNSTESKIKEINTDFKIGEFELSELRDLVEKLKDTNASNLTNDFNSLIDKIETKLQQTKDRFMNIERKKEEILNSTNKISILIFVEKKLRDDVQSDLNKIDEATKRITERNVSVLTSPIRSTIIPVSIPQKNLDYILPELLAFILMTFALFFSSMVTIKEKKSKAYFRNFLTPVKDLTFIFSSYLFLLIIFVIEIFFIILLISKFSTLIDKIFLLNFIPLLLISSTSFIFLGMLIAYLTRDEEICILIIFFILLGSLFFSPTIIPSEMVKQVVIKNIISFLPFNLVENSLRDLIFFKFSITKEFLSLFFFLIYSFIFFLLTFLLRKLTKHQLIYT